MPRAQAAKVIARDLRKHKEQRRRKIKNKATTHTNQHEFLRSSTRKKSKRHQVNDGDLLSDESDFSVLHRGEEEEKNTVTNSLYSALLKDPDFLLTLQPRMYEEEDDPESGEKEEGHSGDVKLSAAMAQDSFWISQSKIQVADSQI